MRLIDCSWLAVQTTTVAVHLSVQDQRAGVDSTKTNGKVPGTQAPIVLCIGQACVGLAHRGFAIHAMELHCSWTHVLVPYGSFRGVCVGVRRCSQRRTCSLQGPVSLTECSIERIDAKTREGMT